MRSSEPTRLHFSSSVALVHSPPSFYSCISQVISRFQSSLFSRGCGAIFRGVLVADRAGHQDHGCSLGARRGIMRQHRDTWKTTERAMEPHRRLSGVRTHQHRNVGSVAHRQSPKTRGFWCRNGVAEGGSSHGLDCRPSEGIQDGETITRDNRTVPEKKASYWDVCVCCADQNLPECSTNVLRRCGEPMVSHRCQPRCQWKHPVVEAHPGRNAVQTQTRLYTGEGSADVACGGGRGICIVGSACCPRAGIDNRTASARRRVQACGAAR